MQRKTSVERIRKSREHAKARQPVAEAGASGPWAKAYTEKEAHLHAPPPKKEKYLRAPKLQANGTELPQAYCKCKNPHTHRQLSRSAIVALGVDAGEAEAPVLRICAGGTSPRRCLLAAGSWHWAPPPVSTQRIVVICGLLLRERGRHVQ